MYAVHSIREKGNWDLLRDVFRMRPTQHPNSLVTGEEIWKYSGNNLFNPLVTSKNQRSQVKSLNLQSNIYLKITPIENLELTSSFSPYFTQTSMGDYILFRLLRFYSKINKFISSSQVILCPSFHHNGVSILQKSCCFFRR